MFHNNGLRCVDKDLNGYHMFGFAGVGSSLDFLSLEETISLHAVVTLSLMDCL